MMRYGIPEYRLPREILDAEVARLTDLGIKIVLNHPVNDSWKKRPRAFRRRLRGHRRPSIQTRRHPDR